MPPEGDNPLIEILKQINELSGAALDALLNGGGGAPPEGGGGEAGGGAPPPEGGGGGPVPAPPGA
jgi:hypothetical protein